MIAFSLTFARRRRVLVSVVVVVVVDVVVVVVVVAFVMKLLIFLVYFLTNKTADMEVALIHTDFYYLLTVVVARKITILTFNG